MANKELRLNLFDKYSQQLEKYLPEYKGKYLCPYCYQAFVKADAENGRLTFAHIIPESVGGDTGVLACSSCNSGTGYIFDPLIQEVWEQRRLFGSGIKPTSKKSWRAEVNGLNVGIDFDVKQKGDTIQLDFFFSPEVTSEKTLFLAYQHYLESIASGRSINFKLIPPYKEMDQNLFRLFKIAALNIAYLNLFKYLGYPYILSKALDQVRQQIIAPDKLKIPTFSLINPALELPEEGVHLIHKSFFPHKFFACRWDILLIFLPTNNDLDFYPFLRDFIPMIKGNSQSFNLPLEYLGFIGNPDVRKLNIPLIYTDEEKYKTYKLIENLEDEARTVIATAAPIEWNRVKQNIKTNL